MVPSAPTLRSDLIVRRQETAHGTSVIIKHPVSGKFFQLGEVEHFISFQLRGETPLETIRQRTEAKFQAELTRETLYGFLQNLEKNGFLETPDQEKRDVHHQPKRFRGSPLYCQFKVLDPCQLLQRMVRRTGFFYTSYFGMLSAATIVLAVGTIFANWTDFREQIPQLYEHWFTILGVLTFNFLIVGAHEFGHGLTCTRFGGEVHEMGCAMIFLQPAFYCNVSDAWLFTEKSKRLWVGFAGPYFELFLWSLAVLIWRMTEPDTLINFITLSVMATSGLKTLLNFNPLIKLDGYYLLSDYLEIPNLRKRSFRYVGTLFETVFGFNSAAEADKENISTRERWIFSVYGTIALAGSFSILGYILASAGGSLIAGRTPIAVLLSIALLGMKFRRRFRRMFADPSGASGSFDDDDFDIPEEEQGPSESSWLEEQCHLSGQASDGFVRTVSGGNWDNAPTTAVATVGTSFGQASGALDSTGGNNEFKRSHLTTEEVDLPPNGHDVLVETPTKPEALDGPPLYKLGVPENGHHSETPDPVSDVDESVAPDDDANFDTQEKASKRDPASASTKKKTRHRRNRKRWLRRSVWAGVAAAAVIASFHFQRELLIAGPLNILPVRNADIRTEIEGVIEQVLVTEGAVIHKGDLVAVLSTRENRSELEKMRGQIQQSNAKFRLQSAGPTPAEIDLGKTAVNKAKDNSDFAKVKLEATQELFKNGLVPRRELDTPEQAYAAAKDDLEDAEGKLKVLQNGTRPEEIDQTRGEIASLQAQERFLEGQIKRAEVRSPVDGVVATPELQLKEMAGQVMQKGALIAKVFDLWKLTVQIAVPEGDIADVKVGEKVSLKVRAYPNQTFNGIVTSIGTSALSEISSPEDASPISNTHTSSASTPGSAKSVLVTTEIDNTSLLLKPGMTGHAKILCGRRSVIDLLHRRAVRTVKVEFWSWW